MVGEQQHEDIAGLAACGHAVHESLVVLDTREQVSEACEPGHLDMLDAAGGNAQGVRGVPDRRPSLQAGISRFEALPLAAVSTVRDTGVVRASRGVVIDGPPAYAEVRDAMDGACGNHPGTGAICAR